MGTDLPGYIQRFELITFFAGYPLFYTLVTVVSGYLPGGAGAGRQKLRMLIPVAYAMAGTFFVLFLICQANRSGDVSVVVLRSWGVLAMLFWWPRSRTSPVWSLLHSLVFFGLVVQDILSGLPTPGGRDQIYNDMTILSLSFLLNVTLFALALLGSFIRRRLRRRPGV